MSDGILAFIILVGAILTLLTINEVLYFFEQRRRK